ncbi:hypothetical protein CEXT_694161 [Caerostris extrusa]|uniref:Uncharacterized protein n=1 Tax=Caerostris extrusa TaxID=172846 RepID=A0AAV4XC34_CAEEX|nr:hypothetical protein CEXT_694161 [Caerostris extrusa]
MRNWSTTDIQDWHNVMRDNDFKNERNVPTLFSPFHPSRQNSAENADAGPYCPFYGTVKASCGTVAIQMFPPYHPPPPMDSTAVYHSNKNTSDGRESIAKMFRFRVSETECKFITWISQSQGGGEI